jgi:hypothetical protein
MKPTGHGIENAHKYRNANPQPQNCAVIFKEWFIKKMSEPLANLHNGEQII